MKNRRDGEVPVEVMSKRVSIDEENVQRPVNVFKKPVHESPQKSLIGQLRSVVVGYWMNSEF